MCEITRNSEKIQTYSNSRLFKVIDIVANRKRICNFLLIINNITLGPSGTVFKILTHLARKYVVSPSHHCLTPPIKGNPLEFREKYPPITWRMGLLYNENCIILTSTVLDWPVRVKMWWTYRQADRRTDRRTGDSMYMLSRAKYTFYLCY